MEEWKRMADYRSYNPETAAEDNREPGIVIVPGSNYAKEMAKFEQFPSKYGENPGNPYTYRPFPKMVYKAELYQGMIRCMAQVAPNEFVNVNEQMRAEEAARQFTEKCQRVVKDQLEFQRAMEMGYRESPTEAVEYLEAKQKALADAAAERNFADRNMSDKAKAEAAAEVQRAFTEEGSHAAEVPEKPIKRNHSEAMKAAWAKRKAKQNAA
jgi:hypothetical protein